MLARMRPYIVVAVFCALPACYHATIDTGRTPSAQTVEKSFAASWIYGLVPPSAVETASRCPNGVSRVETQLSFVNQLVAFLTLYIYTPMSIKVTCAAGGETSSADGEGAAGIVLQPDATAEAKQQALTEAAQQSLLTRSPVFVRFEVAPEE